MKLWLNSLIFHIFFYGWTALCVLIFIPFLFLPKSYILSMTRVWGAGVFQISSRILGLRFEVLGQENVPSTPLIFAAKHQSVWETIIFHYLHFDVAIVLKKDLMRIPIFGWYLKKLGMIPLSRSRRKGAKNLKKLLKSAQYAVKEGRQVLIFPEGTRSKPGQEGIYHTGVASLYLHLNLPVVPVALNSGVYWPRRGFLRYPGVITVAFLDPIYPGLSRKYFMKKLQHEIESTTQNLLKRSPSHV